eukprot:74004-Alexandrium_andersonii.AAC.1
MGFNNQTELFRYSLSMGKSRKHRLIFRARGDFAGGRLRGRRRLRGPGGRFQAAALRRGLHRRWRDCVPRR